MKVLFATTNQAKVNRYQEQLKRNGIDLITLKDLEFKLDIDENGKDALENALIKAKTYYEKLHIPTIGMDDNLYIEELPKEKQPGTHVKRINGKELNDDEIIKYYTNLVKQYGKKLTVKWVFGMVIINNDKIYKYTWNSDIFNSVDTPCENRTKGYPLNSITIIPKYNKYLAELSKKEKMEYDSLKDNTGTIKFILNSLEK